MPKGEYVTMRIDVDTKRKLKVEAKRQNRTLINLVEVILKEAVKEGCGDGVSGDS